MAWVTRAVGGYGFSLVFSRYGTSSCGAPYGSRPARSSRSGRAAGSVTVTGTLMSARSFRDPHPDRGYVRGQLLLAAEGVDERRGLGQALTGALDQVEQ